MKAIRNIIAFVVLNIWLLPKGGGRYVTYCPKCHNASLLHAYGHAHCEICDHHPKGKAKGWQR